MVMALLVILGVDLIVLGIFCAFVLGREGWVTRQACSTMRSASSMARSTVFGPKWTRRYGRWVRDVLRRTKAPFLLSNDPIALDSVGEHRPAAPSDVKRLGTDLIIVVLKAVTATVEIAAHGDDLDRVSGPFRPAEAGHV
jgi:hypothetical protein